MVPIVFPPVDTSDRSRDVPSGPGVRPWGLTQVSVVTAHELVDGLVYDPELQITRTADGTPLAETVRGTDPTGPYTPTDSRYDHRWVTDQDASD